MPHVRSPYKATEAAKRYYINHRSEITTRLGKARFMNAIAEAGIEQTCPCCEGRGKVQMYVEDVPHETIDALCEIQCVPKALLFSPRRFKRLVETRCMLTEYLYTEAGWTLTAIGTLLDRDHSTLIHARHCHSDYIEMYADYRSRYNLFKTIAINNLSTKE